MKSSGRRAFCSARLFLDDTNSEGVHPEENEKKNAKKLVNPFLRSGQSPETGGGDGTEKSLTLFRADSVKVTGREPARERAMESSSSLFIADL